MSKVSAAFGEAIKSFLKDHGLTFRAAAFRSGISAAYWKDMSDGRVPSEDVIERICGSFEDLDENELRTAAGYALRIESADAVTAVEFALRGQPAIPDEGKKQIVDFVKKIQNRYSQREDK